ncbi:MAG: dihydrofolate reductase family protein [Candidatus Nanopelagicales bacterium]
MTSAHAFIATSLDGYIAREDGDISWLLERDDPTEDHGYNDFIADIGVIVMGRGSYDKVLTFDQWPYELPVVVLSATLTDSDVPLHLVGKVEVTSQTPSQVMQDLAHRGLDRVYLDGGRVIQSFLRAGLVSDLVVTTVPVILGAGRRLFGEVSTDIDLALVDVRRFPSGLVQSKYSVKAPN